MSAPTSPADRDALLIELTRLLEQGTRPADAYAMVGRHRDTIRKYVNTVSQIDGYPLDLERIRRSLELPLRGLPMLEEVRYLLSYGMHPMQVCKQMDRSVSSISMAARKQCDRDKTEQWRWVATLFGGFDQNPDHFYDPVQHVGRALLQAA